LFSGQRYIRYAVAQQWLTNHQHLAEGIKRQDIQCFLPPEAQPYLQTIRPLLMQGHDYIATLNEAYVQQELSDFQRFFDQVESNPLTANQRKACVIDEQYNLVLAGAGTGKTSTMIGRAGYLIKAGIARPEKILMLAFARKAAEEMDERIQTKLGINNLTVKTFHSLGKQIITQVEGVVPAINKMAEDERLRTSFVDEQIQRLLLDELYKSRFVTYFLRFSYPYKSAFNFKSLGEYNNYLLENEIRTLQGELVKSYEKNARSPIFCFVSALRINMKPIIRSILRDRIIAFTNRIFICLSTAFISNILPSTKTIKPLRLSTSKAIWPVWPGSGHCINSIKRNS